MILSLFFRFFFFFHCFHKYVYIYIFWAPMIHNWLCHCVLYFSLYDLNNFIVGGGGVVCVYKTVCAIKLLKFWKQSNKGWCQRTNDSIRIDSMLWLGCWIRNRFMVRAYIDVVQQLGKIKRSLCFVCISYCSDWFVPESAVIDVCSYINRFLIVPASLIDILLMFKYRSHWIDWTFLFRIESLLRMETHSVILLNPIRWMKI